MDFICFVASDTSSVPHMEALSALSVGEALEQAAALWEQHGSASAIHIYSDDELAASLTRPGGSDRPEFTTVQGGDRSRAPEASRAGSNGAGAR